MSRRAAAAKPEDGEAIQTARQDVAAALQQVSYA